MSLSGELLCARVYLAADLPEEMFHLRYVREPFLDLLGDFLQRGELVQSLRENEKW